MRPLLAALAALLLMASSLHAETPVAEPDGLWQGAMHGTTPRTLKGATVVDDAGLVQLLEGHPLLIDVGPADRKPASLSASPSSRPRSRTGIRQ